MDYYHKSSDRILLKEFGRNIQNMVDYVVSVEDRTKRTGLAYEMIRIMACLTPAQKETAENREKLWDQLYIMSDYKLDVDCPVSVPQRHDNIPDATERMPYSRLKPRFRQYGVNVQNMLDEALQKTDPEEQKALVTVTANYMKNLIKGSDKDTNVESIVRSHLKEMTKGKLLFEIDSIVFSKVQPQSPKAVNVVQKSNRPGGNFNNNKKSFGTFNRNQGNNNNNNNNNRNQGGNNPGNRNSNNNSSNNNNRFGGRPGGSSGGSNFGSSQGNRPRRPRI